MSVNAKMAFGVLPPLRIPRHVVSDHEYNGAQRTSNYIPSSSLPVNNPRNLAILHEDVAQSKVAMREADTISRLVS